ncbi:MAG TPA: hypothetical protein VGU46_11245, partial [Acidobacteriaceae bacterium]|nr:hypothetical protein [Acidobacteriaceae bacterium]
MSKIPTIADAFALLDQSKFDVAEGVGHEPNKCECAWSSWHSTRAERAAESTKLAHDQLATLRGELAILRVQQPQKRGRKGTIPALKPHTIAKFLQAIPRAVALGEITAAQANSLLYAGQVFISLLRATTPP